MTSLEVMPDSSRVWIYQSDRVFLGEEVNSINHELRQFVDNWVSHNKALKAYGGLEHQRFVILMVDESQAGASGCSIDSSVHFIKSLGAKYEVDFFNRMNFAYLNNDNVNTAERNEFAQLFQSGKINDETIVFNNLVKTKAEFDSSWTVALKDSWHARMVGV